jgi:hypothetical protein
MLRLEQHDRGCGIVAYCDQCGAAIADCTMANSACFGDGPFELVHKTCTPAYDRDHPGCGMDEMRHWLILLESAIGFTEEVRRQAAADVHAVIRCGLVVSMP